MLVNQETLVSDFHDGTEMYDFYEDSLMLEPTAPQGELTAESYSKGKVFLIFLLSGLTSVCQDKIFDVFQQNGKPECHRNKRISVSVPRK